MSKIRSRMISGAWRSAVLARSRRRSPIRAPRAVAPRRPRPSDDDDPRNKLDGQPAVRNRLLLVKQPRRGDAAVRVDDQRRLPPHPRRRRQARVPRLRHALVRRRSACSRPRSTPRWSTASCRRSRPNPDNTTREPSQQEFTQHLNTMPFHGAAYVALTPWYGKLAAFGEGVRELRLLLPGRPLVRAACKSNCDTGDLQRHAPRPVERPEPTGTMVPPDDNPNNDPPLNSGTQAGPLPRRRHPRLRERVASRST